MAVLPIVSTVWLASCYTWHWFILSVYLWGKLQTPCCHTWRYFPLCAGVSNIVQWKITDHGETHSSIVIYRSSSWWATAARILPVSSACWFPAVQSSTTWLKVMMLLLARQATQQICKLLSNRGLQHLQLHPSSSASLCCISLAEDSGT